MVSCKYNIISDIKNGSSNRLRESYISKYHKDLYNKIIEYTLNIDIPFKQRIWHWVNNEPNYVKCECGNILSFNMNWEDGYKKYCSSKCSSNNNITKEKMKSTNFIKYGVEYYSQTEMYSKQIIKTSNDKWGVDNYAKSDDYINKSKETYFKKYGVDNYTKTKEYIEKSKKTCLDKYGVDSYVKTNEYKEKFRNSLINKYGVDSYFKYENNRMDLKISNDPNYKKYSPELSINIFRCDCGEFHDFEISTDNYYGRMRNNNKLCTVCNPISSLSSIKEKTLYDFIFENYDEDIIRSYRNKYEIDIYLPKLNIGIEFNGIYWHSDKFKDRFYHFDKMNYFNNLGIHIYNIWEDDWIYKEGIIKSQLLNFIGLTKSKIYARDCEILEIKDSKITSEFLNNNHIQGVVNSSVKIGLFYKNELVSLMTFDKYEGRKKMILDDWNLNRFCNIKDFIIIGGASKLLKYFIKNYNPNRIISYADRSWSNGNLYYKLGFNKLYETKPDYKYVINNKRYNKSRFRKSKTKTLLTESKYAQINNMYKIWDCGKIKFEMILKIPTN